MSILLTAAEKKCFVRYGKEHFAVTVLKYNKCSVFCNTFYVYIPSEWNVPKLK